MIVVPKGTGREITLEFEYRFFDRYNWDGGKSVIIAAVLMKVLFEGPIFVSYGLMYLRGSDDDTP